jgi:hypothetical protein
MLRHNEEHQLGTSKRYAQHYDRGMDAKILEAIMAGGLPTSLVDEELELGEQPLTKTPKPLPVTAWVRYGQSPLKITGRAVAWTSRAVAIEWKTPTGAVHRAWVWSSAVEGLEADQRGSSV